VDVWIAPEAFDYESLLFEAVGHELQHCDDFYSGRYLNWYNESGSWNYADIMSEYYAHKWSYEVAEKLYNDPHGHQDQMMVYYHLIKNFGRKRYDW